MRVYIGDQTYFVSFEVSRYDPPQMVSGKHAFSHGKLKGQPKLLPISHRTSCVIRVAPTESATSAKAAEFVIRAESWCSVNDEFNVHTGRRNALKKALDKLTVNQQIDRLPFWEEFIKYLPKAQPTVKQLKFQLNVLNKRVEALTILATKSILHD
jgi:hypothetical protein